MKTFAVFIAQATPPPAQKPIEKQDNSKVAPPPPKLFNPLRGNLGAPTEIVVLLGAVFLLAILLVGWAVFIRKPSRRSLAGMGPVLYEGSRGSSGRKRRRSRNRDDLPRNPTLKDTGGLPPARESHENPASDTSQEAQDRSKMT